MFRGRYIEGEMNQGKDPDWEPLVDVIGDVLPGWFMWMFDVKLVDGRTLNAYKHRMTRQYIHLTREGGAYDYRAPDFYAEVDLAMSIRRAFPSEEIKELPEDQIEELDAAIEKAELRSEGSYNESD